MSNARTPGWPAPRARIARRYADAPSSVPTASQAVHLPARRVISAPGPFGRRRILARRGPRTIGLGRRARARDIAFRARPPRHGRGRDIARAPRPLFARDGPRGRRPGTRDARAALLGVLPVARAARPGPARVLQTPVGRYADRDQAPIRAALDHRRDRRDDSDQLAGAPGGLRAPCRRACRRRLPRRLL